MSCDVGDGPALARFITEAATALGGIDILINNASGIGLTDDENGWLAGINVDLLATVRASRAAVPFMEKAGGGIIVNISSIAGLMALARALPYAGKGGARQLHHGTGARFGRKTYPGQRHCARLYRISRRCMGSAEAPQS